MKCLAWKFMYNPSTLSIFLALLHELHGKPIKLLKTESKSEHRRNE